MNSPNLSLGLGKETYLKIYKLLIWIALLLSFAGCSAVPSATEPPATNPPVNSPSQHDSSNNPVSPNNTPDFSAVTPPPAEANPFMKLAEEDLAERLTINVDQIRFLKISDIDWQDITQGCTTSAGQRLTKGRLSGYRIWLESDGKNYLYHIGLDQTVLYCTTQP
jgi:hypothetical protein